jgi:hypothetical protein
VSAVPDSSQLQTYRTQFAEAKQTVQSLTAGLSDDQFNQAPASGKWSVGQCLDHLNEAGGLLVPRLEAAIERAQREGPFAEGPFRYGIFSRWFIRMMEPGSSMKLPAPSGYTPAPEPLDPEAVGTAFAALQDRLIACTERADGLDLRRIRVGSPLASWVRLSLGAWLEATAAHQRRHLQQARRVLQAIDVSTD